MPSIKNNKKPKIKGQIMENEKMDSQINKDVVQLCQKLTFKNDQIDNFTQNEEPLNLKFDFSRKKSVEIGVNTVQNKKLYTLED